jgi:hypothetical protein
MECQVYNKMANRLHNILISGANYKPNKLILRMAEHLSLCPICKARMEEMNELSKRCSNSCEAMCMDD